MDHETSHPGWKKDAAGNVVITMTPDDRRIVALLNRLNAGNPNYTPYQVEPEESRG